ncbi:MAG: arginine N-succinyltransferase [Thermodesulfobacteriota bacterium]
MWVAVAAAVALAAVAVAGWSLLFPRQFRPVVLAPGEQEALEAKLERLEPERYREDEESRTVRFTERELDSLVARNTDLASRLALHLSGDLLSAKLLVPMDEDFPFLGGKVVRVTAGLELAFAEGRPRVALRGVSVMGVPIPNAWLGGIKNVDLAKEFAAGEGFWHAFSAGVSDLRVEDGALLLRLKE